MRPGRIKAVIVDVDGTLYRQGPVRRTMARRLLLHAALRPADGFRVLRALRAYRQAQETLRKPGAGGAASRQIQLAAEATGYSADWIASCMQLWMEEMPLDAVRDARFPGVVEFCEWAAGEGIALGVLSDYPAQAKLQAMEIHRYFQVAICAQDAAVDRFKPHPAGLRHVLERLGVEAGDAVYVGDRAEVDGAAAKAAGMECLLIGSAVPDWNALREALAVRLAPCKDRN